MTTPTSTGAWKPSGPWRSEPATARRTCRAWSAPMSLRSSKRRSHGNAPNGSSGRAELAGRSWSVGTGRGPRTTRRRPRRTRASRSWGGCARGLGWRRRRRRRRSPSSRRKRLATHFRTTASRRGSATLASSRASWSSADRSRCGLKWTIRETRWRASARAPSTAPATASTSKGCLQKRVALSTAGRSRCPARSR